MGSLVVKDNALIEAGHRLSEVEQRLILIAILNVREKGDIVEELKDKVLEINIEDYIKHFGGTRQNARKSLKQAVMGLYRAEWGYKYLNKNNEPRVRYERFTQSADYGEGDGIVKFMFSTAILPLLVELKKNFTEYEITQVSNLSSRYAMRLYEMLMQYYNDKKGEGWLEISLEDFRFRLGLLPTEYKTMSNFKQFVLDIAIEQVNKHTNLEVEYEQKKRGRSITGFKFTFRAKVKPQKSTKALLERDKNTVDMLSPIKMTDKQRLMFANKLSELPELSGYAPIGMDYKDYAKHIANELLNPAKAEFYRPLLKKVGFEF